MSLNGKINAELDIEMASGRALKYIGCLDEKKYEIRDNQGRSVCVRKRGKVRRNEGPDTVHHGYRNSCNCV